MPDFLRRQRWQHTEMMMIMMEKEEKRKKEGREGGWEDDDGRTIFALPYDAAPKRRWRRNHTGAAVAG